MVSKVTEAAIAHFESKGEKKIHVPEWDVTIHAKPLNMREKAQIFKGVADNDLKALVDVLILKATDADGNRLFSAEDKHPLLRKADPDVIARVATEILDAPSVEELAGN